MFHLPYYRLNVSDVRLGRPHTLSLPTSTFILVPLVNWARIAYKMSKSKNKRIFIFIDKHATNKRQKILKMRNWNRMTLLFLLFLSDCLMKNVRIRRGKMMNINLSVVLKQLARVFVAYTFAGNMGLVCTQVN